MVGRSASTASRMIISYKVQLTREQARQRTPVFDVHGLRFLIGLRVTAGDLVCLESVGVVPAGLGTGNANVGDGDAEFVADTPAGGDAVALGNGSGLCTGLGDGEGGIIFSQ